MPPGSAGSSKGKDLKLVVVGSGGEYLDCLPVAVLTVKALARVRLQYGLLHHNFTIGKPQPSHLDLTDGLRGYNPTIEDS